jgi:hypothetical protein
VTKLLLLLLLVAPSAHAVTLARFLSSPAGNSLQSFSLGASPRYLKRSNFFDQKLDLRLGTFALPAGESVAAEERALAAVLDKLRAVDEGLRKQKSSFNDLSPKAPHAPYILVDEYRVAPSSVLYAELLKLFEGLLQKKWRHLDGIRIDEDLKQITVLKDGKAAATEKFNYAFHCNRERPPGYCLFKEIGILFIQ